MITKAEKKRRLVILKRSKAAIKRLNDPNRIKRRIKEFGKELDKILASTTDFDKVEDLLSAEEIPYEVTSFNGITSSIVIHFGDDGELLS
jgi:hypothetical protein